MSLSKLGSRLLTFVGNLLLPVLDLLALKGLAYLTTPALSSADRTSVSAVVPSSTSLRKVRTEAAKLSTAFAHSTRCCFSRLNQPPVPRASFVILVLKSAVNRGATNTQLLRDGGRSKPLRLKFAHLSGVQPRWPALVDTCRLGLGNAFKLAFPPQVGLELSEHAKHIQEALARRRARVDWLLKRLQGGAAFLQGPHDVLEVSDRPRQSVNARDDERIALADELQDGCKLGAPLGARAACLLRTDDLASRRLKRFKLKREVLVSRADACVPDRCHGPPPVSFGSKPRKDTVS